MTSKGIAHREGADQLRTLAQKAEAGDEGAASRLATDRETVFQDDARWRNTKLRLGADPYKTMMRLYETVGAKAVDSDGIPTENIVQPATNDLMAAAVASMPKCRLRVEPNFSRAEDAAEADALWQAAQETERRINLVVDHTMQRSELPDVNEKTVRQAAIFGMGVEGVWIDRTLDDRIAEVKQLTMRFEQEGWLSDADWKRLDHLSKRVEVRNFDCRDVVWQRGVRSAYNRAEMLRCSYYELLTTEGARARYADDKIMPGQGVWYVGSDRREDYGRSERTGVVTTWEQHREAKTLEKTQHFMGLSGMKGVRRVLPFTSTVMVKTTVAGGRLVDVEVWDSSEGLVELPFAPFYLRESQEHPYGLCIPLLYEQQQAFRNRIRNLIYKQAFKSFAGAGGLIDGQELPSNMSAEDITEALRRGDWVKVDLGDSSRNKKLTDIFMPGSQVVDGVAPALIQIYQMHIAEASRSSEMVDVDALARARTGKAKELQLAQSDRPKTITLGHLSQATERVYDLTCKTIKALRGNETVRESVPGAPGGFVGLNEREQVDIPRLDPEGNPIQTPIPMSEYPDGVVTRKTEVVYGDLSLETFAQAESRGSLPHQMTQRLQLLDLLAQEERYIQQDTARELVLDPDLLARDNANRQKRAEAQQEQGGGLAEMIPEDIRQMAPEDVRAENAALEAAAQELGLDIDGLLAQQAAQATTEAAEAA